MMSMVYYSCFTWMSCKIFYSFGGAANMLHTQTRKKNIGRILCEQRYSFASNRLYHIQLRATSYYPSPNEYNDMAIIYRRYNMHTQLQHYHPRAKKRRRNINVLLFISVSFILCLDTIFFCCSSFALLFHLLGYVVLSIAFSLSLSYLSPPAHSIEIHVFLCFIFLFLC